jgi:hypothetical protein
MHPTCVPDQLSISRATHYQYMIRRVRAPGKFRHKISIRFSNAKNEGWPEHKHPHVMYKESATIVIDSHKTYNSMRSGQMQL